MDNNDGIIFVFQDFYIQKSTFISARICDSKKMRLIFFSVSCDLIGRQRLSCCRGWILTNQRAGNKSQIFLRVEKKSCHISDLHTFTSINLFLQI